MRIFTNCSDMMNEVARDLYEMGVVRCTLTMQDKDISGDSDFVTKELINYSFCVTDPLRSINGLFLLPNQNRIMYDWCKLEFSERINSRFINPGGAWVLRSEVWEPFLTRNRGRFAYTYNERIRTQLPLIIERLGEDVWSRQCILTIWNPTIDVNRLGIDRVPCSIYYHFLASEIDGKPSLNLIYAMRSCDFVTHMPNDVYLAILLLEYVCQCVAMPIGKFFMNISSLHYYKKDEGVLDEFMRSKRYG